MIIIFCLLFFTLDCAFCTLPSSSSLSIRIKISESCVSSIHTITCLFLSSHVLFDDLFWNNRISHTSPTSSLMISISAGYFLYDFLVCIIRYNKSKDIFLLHAIICFISFSIGFYYGTFHLYGALALVFEASTLFINNHYIMKAINFKNTYCVIINDILLISAYFTCRILWGSYCIYLVTIDMYNLQPKSIILFNLLSIICVYMMSWKWFLTMINKI